MSCQPHAATQSTTATDKETGAITRSNILECFQGAHVLVSGGTGFLGQVLMEKLLRTCQIGKLYVIIRPKKGFTEKERAEKVFGGVLYDRAKREQPHCMSKVVLITGDFEKPGLGLSEGDRAVLVREVDVIFHCAATVRFDEKLGTAVSINVLGTKHMLDMAREMPHLNAFVHFSTAYSNCTMKEIGERFYSPPMSWTDLVQLTASLDERTIEMTTSTVIGNWPNTYTFTKAVAEDMIKEEARGLPVGILRPSVVLFTAHEPLVGWSNHMYGPLGLIAGVLAGIIRSMHCDGDYIADVLPVDMVINSAIAVAWDLAQHTTKTKLMQLNTATVTPSECEDGVTIFNNVSSVQNPVTWGEITRFIEQGNIYPSLKFIWYCCCSLNKHRLIHNIYVLFLHLLPALLVDTGAKITGKQPRFLKMYQKVHQHIDVTSYFTTHQWTFVNDNIQNLWKKMSPQDKHLFNFDITLVNWKELVFTGVRGLRVYVMEDPILHVEEEVSRYKRLKYLHYTAVYLFRLLVLYVTYWFAFHYWIGYKDI